MKQQEYLDLISRFEASSLTCLEIEEETFKIRMERSAPGSSATAVVSASALAPADAEDRRLSGRPGAEDNETAENLIPVKAPLVGVFYAAPAPGEAPFAAVGSRVEKGQTLCLIEAMKMMNELKSPVGGIVRTVRGMDGQLAEYGQILFEVEPC